LKKHEIYKTVQLGIFIALAVIGIVKIFFDKDIYYNVAGNASLSILCGMLWLVLLVSFIFIYLDFKYFLNYMKDYKELGYAVKSDPVSGINNRFSCDMLIEQYLDKPLPENMGCVMIDISNIQEINRLYGHVQGNISIREFSDLLTTAAGDLCFIGRNGGNKFMALFENASQSDIDIFLERLAQKVDAYNSGVNTLPVEYDYGVAFHEGDTVKTITELIALSNRRISGKNESKKKPEAIPSETEKNS